MIRIEIIFSHFKSIPLGASGEGFRKQIKEGKSLFILRGLVSCDANETSFELPLIWRVPCKIYPNIFRVLAWFFLIYKYDNQLKNIWVTLQINSQGSDLMGNWHGTVLGNPKTQMEKLPYLLTYISIISTYALDTIQDFFCKLGMKSHTQLNSGSHHLLTHSIYYIIYFAALFCNKTTWNIVGMIKMIQARYTNSNTL